MTTSSAQLHLAVALDGAGWHPAAWRLPSARSRELADARYWRDLVLEAERGRLDFVTIEDAMSLQSSARSGTDTATDEVRGRLDAVLIAARVAPLTDHIGLVPTATVTHTEPFHVSTSIATLDYVSNGRAGWRAQISSRAHEARHFGRRQMPAFELADRGTPAVQALLDDLFEEAGDFVEVVRRLWDSWEDDAEIRDAATGRFVDREKLHYIDFEGRSFSVRGPSITPRPPQGQPLVTALAHVDVAYRFAARSADIVFVTPTSNERATEIMATLRAEQDAAGRADPLHVFGDLVVLLRRGSRSRPGSPGVPRRARRDALSSPTPRCTSETRRDWLTCCSNANAPASAVSGSGRPRCPRTCTPSPASWCRSCNGAGPSAPTTQTRRRCGGCSGCLARPTGTPRHDPMTSDPVTP